MVRPQSSILLFTTLLSVLLVMSPEISRATTWPLIPSEPDPVYLGWSVDIYGDVAIVSDPGWSHPDSRWPDTDQGGAYIFRWNGTEWLEEDFIFEATGNASDRFGTRVAITDEFAFASVGWDEKIVIFRHDGAGNWEEFQVIFGNNGSLATSFDADGNYLAVGDPNADSGSGRVYVYNWNGVEWVTDPRLPSRQPYLNCAGDTCYSLGQSVAIRSNGYIVEVLAGAPRFGWNEYCGIAGNEQDPVGPGAAYLWELNKMAVLPRWSLSHTFSAWDVSSSPPSTYNEFGRAVALDHHVAIGAPQRIQEINGDFYSGGVYIFDRDDNWSGTVFLPGPSDCVNRHSFLGMDVATEGDVVLATDNKQLGFEYHLDCSWFGCTWLSGGQVNDSCRVVSMDDSLAVCGNHHAYFDGMAEIFDDF